MADKQPMKGRRKIPMRKIESIEDRLITFSKRRGGIYKKAAELSTLCGVEVGVLIFSPAGKPFAYGIPNIEAVSDKFMYRSRHDNQSLASLLMEARRREKVEELNKSCDELSGCFMTLKKEGERLVEEGKRKGQVKDGGGACWWWDVPVEDLKVDEMEKMTMTMEEVKENASRRLGDLMEAKALASAYANVTDGLVSPTPLQPDYGGFAAYPRAFDDLSYGYGYEYGYGYGYDYDYGYGYDYDYGYY